MAIIPLEEIKNQLMQGNLSLTQSILGPHCYAQLSGLFDQQEFSFAAFKYLPNVGGQANSPLGSLAGVNQISFDGTLTVLGRFMWKDVPVRFSLFDRDTQSAPERHAVLKIEIPPKLEANADLQEYRAGADITSLIAYVQEDGGADNTSPIAKSAESMIDLYVENLVLGEKAVIFSSLDYSVGFDQIYPTGFEELVPANEIRAGLNLPLQITINSDVSAIFGDLLAGFPLEGQIPGHGVVCQSDSIPYLIVGRTINAELTLGLLKLKLDRFGLGFALIEAGDMAPQVIIDGSIGFGSQSCTVEADYDLYHRTLALAFRAFPSLRTLLSEMGNTDEYFPKPFDILLEIQLSKLEIIFDLNARSVRELSLSVTTEHDIELIDNIISIKPTLDLDIYDPFDADSRSLEGMLTGIWELGSTKFETTLTYPTYDFHAAMAEGESLDLAALAEKVFGMPLPKISITGMELVGNFNDKSFSINLVVASDWKIKLAADKTLDLKQVQLSMRYADHQREYEAACVLTLAGVDLFIWAHYAKSWQFNGSTGPGQKIPIGRLMGDLENLFGIDADLPDSLEALTISNLAMSYDSTGFSFGCETEFKVDGQPVDMVITITIKKVEPKKPEKSEQPKKSEVLEKSTRTKSTSKKNDEGSYTKDFDGHLTVAGRKFNLSCHKEAGASRMVASYRKDGGDRIELRDLIGGDLGEQIPESLAITIDDVYLAYCKEGIAEQDDVKKSAAKGKSAVTGKEKAAAAFSGFLLGADLKASIQLSDIPLAGESLPAGLTAGVDQLRVLLASNSFQATHLKGINEELTKAGIAELKLPGELGEAKAEGEADEVVVGKGLSLSAVLTLGESKRAISLTTAKSKSAESGKGDGGKKTPEVAHDIAAPASDNSVITPAAETSLAASAAADTTLRPPSRAEAPPGSRWTKSSDRSSSTASVSSTRTARSGCC
ncbi:hypothetical protein [Rubritalea profundi]|uniref:Uncharacterized protein n=1 Tax=Rubritalea profundi TaxID=1658618 RepID=A0A2S7U6K7_9BACT|nr:hypothetical protein [Rubritalea profundi]PQJ29843.1 hypothetical protein BSZ32_16045 [Rubritalea profundi]